MRAVPQAVQDPQLDAVQGRKGRLVERAHVGRIGDLSKAVAQTGPAPVLLHEGHDPNAADLERAFDRNVVQDRRIQPIGVVAGGEGVAEALDQGLPGRPIHVGVDRAAARIGHGAQLVEAVAVIGVGVGEQDRVDRPGPAVKQLGAQVGRGVDEQGGAPLLHQNRHPAAPVARMVRIADAPVAARGAVGEGDAAGAAATENGDLHAGDCHIGTCGRAGRAALANRRKTLSPVARTSSSGGTPLSSARAAAVWTT